MQILKQKPKIGAKINKTKQKIRFSVLTATEKKTRPPIRHNTMYVPFVAKTILYTLLCCRRCCWCWLLTIVVVVGKIIISK